VDGGVITIEMAWPPRALSPNGRVHFMQKTRFKQAAKDTAYWLTKQATRCKPLDHDGEIAVRIIAHPPKAWRTGDADNLIASCKSQLDGIAAALQVNDRQFRAPTVEWAQRVEGGKLVIAVEPAA
jgi:crossover junction endodeoxyribonuclease RusA